MSSTDSYALNWTLLLQAQKNQYCPPNGRLQSQLFEPVKMQIFLFLW